MTAPESSPLGAAKPAEAVAPGFSPWTKESAEACLITTDGNGKENKRRALRFLIKQATEAAIQRGDGQTDGWTGKKCPKCSGTGETNIDGNSSCTACAGTGDEWGKLPTPPAAKPNETSGATPETLAAIYVIKNPGERGEGVNMVKAEFASGLEIQRNAAMEELKRRMSEAERVLAVNENLYQEVIHLRAELNAVRAAGAEGKAYNEYALSLLEYMFDCGFAYKAQKATAEQARSAAKSLAEECCAKLNAAKSTPGVSGYDYDLAEAAGDLAAWAESIRTVHTHPFLNDFPITKVRSLLEKRFTKQAVKQEQTGGATS